MSEPIQTKQCSKCKQIKVTSDFYRQSDRKCGLRSMCIACVKEKKKIYRKAHVAQIREYQSKYNKPYQTKYRKTLSGYMRKIWSGMQRRCNNPDFKQYKDYGGRGIQVKFACFEDFYNYVVKELKVDPRGLTIDRIDNDGHYEKGNIQFITRPENTKKRFN